MRKFPFQKMDDEDIEILRAKIAKKDSRYRVNEVYTEIVNKQKSKREYEPPKKDNNDTE